MAFQPINFLNAPEAESPYKDIFGSIAKGMEPELQRRKIANQLMQAMHNEQLAKKEGINVSQQQALNEALMNQRNSAAGASQGQEYLSRERGRYVAPVETARANQFNTAANYNQERANWVAPVAKSQVSNYSNQAKEHFEKALSEQTLRPYKVNDIQAAKELKQASIKLTQAKISDLASGGVTRAIATQNAKLYGTLANQQEKSEATLSSLNDINDLIESDPKLAQSTFGPGANLRYIFGTKKQKEMLSSLNASSANLVSDMAGQFKGAFTNKDLQLVLSSKPNSTDTAGQIKAKTKNLIHYQKIASARRSRIMEHISKGIPAHEAMIMAKNEIPMEKNINNEIHTSYVRDPTTGRLVAQ